MMQDVKNFLVFCMDGILERVEDLPERCFLPMMVIISFIINIILLMKWFKNRNKLIQVMQSSQDSFEILIQRIQEMQNSLQESKKGLVENIQDIKNDNVGLTNRFKETEHKIELFSGKMCSIDRIEKLEHNVETFNDKHGSMFDDFTSKLQRLEHKIEMLAEKNCSMSESNGKLTDRISFVEGSLHAIEVLAKDENIRNLESHVNDECKKMKDSMTSLENHLSQELQELRETMMNRLQDLEDAQSDTSESEIQATGQDRSFPKLLKCRNDFPKVAMRSPMVFPVSVSEKPATKKQSNGPIAYHWEPIQMKDLKNIKEAIVMYGLHSPFVRELLTSWATVNKVTPKDWAQLASAVLENSCQIQWRALWRQEAKAIEIQELQNGHEVPQDKILGEGPYADTQVQSAYDEHMLSLCRTAALNALDKVCETGEIMQPYTKVLQGPRERFTEFLERLSRAVEVQVANPESRRLLIESLAYENANPQCRQVIWPLKIRSAPLEEWVLHTANLECKSQDTGAWVGEAISTGLRRHQDAKYPTCDDIEAWVGKAISKNLNRRKDAKCFNCGRIGHLSRNCRQRIPRNNAFTRNVSNRRPKPPGLCRRCGKGRHWTDECFSTIDRQGRSLQQGNGLPGLHGAPKRKIIRSFPVTVEDSLSQDN